MDDKMAELLIEEIRLLRQEIKEMRQEFYKELGGAKKDITTLKTRFMIVAVTMGLAGGKISSVIPFLK